jgi:uncharacterized protein YndB with AHSA1/START domain
MNQATREIVITRVFNAPRERVWQAWTEPERIKCWWGPRGFTTPYYAIDLQVGGKYLNCMRSSAGEDYWSTGTYLEVVTHEKLVSTDSFADKDGNIVPASAYGISVEWAADAQIALTFEDLAGKTRLTLKHSGVPEGKDGDLTEEGWEESFDRLAKCLKQPKV